MRNQLNFSKLQFIKKRIWAFFLFLIISSFFVVFGQERTITGNIISSDNNETLPGVNILIKGTTRGTISDLDGNYTIAVEPADSVLVFSFVGYNPKEVRIGSQSVIDVVLGQESVQLDQVVVIGYGTIKKSDLTGSVSSVKAKDLYQNHFNKCRTESYGKSSRRAGDQHIRGSWCNTGDQNQGRRHL